MYGKIVKGIGGFYYVHLYLCNDKKIKITPASAVYECKAKGIFRNQNIKPKIGDEVEIDILDEEKKLGNITKIYPRENDLIRPAVSNVDQAIIVFALTDPNPNFNLMDRFIIMLEQQGLNAVVCINKCDLEEELILRNSNSEFGSNEDETAEMKSQDIKKAYEAAGHKVVLCSTKTGIGIDEISELTAHKTTVFAGPSGVGKSSLLNILNPQIDAATGELSEKIKRGKHTTRHSELMSIGDDTFIMDTPGFSSLEVFDTEPEELKNYYGEFDIYEPNCRFNGCIHINEPDCGVKKALESDEISRLRYGNYKQIYDELKSKRKW